MKSSEMRLSECLRLLEETQDIDRCVALYPDLEQDIRASLAAISQLRRINSSVPELSGIDASRRSLFSALAAKQGGHSVIRNLLQGRALAGLAALGIIAFGAVGAGASGAATESGPLNDVLSHVGVVEKSDHGSAVRDAVHEAKETTPPGPERGRAVSEAACTAAHDRSTLPAGAQNAPGQEGRDPKDCDKATESQSQPDDDDKPGRGRGKPEDAGKPSVTPSSINPASTPDRPGRGRP